MIASRIAFFSFHLEPMTKIKSFPGLFSSSCLTLTLFALMGCHCIPCSHSSSVSTSEPATNFIQLAPLAPPPAIYEPVPEIASPRTAIWRPGYWHYNSGSDFSWVSGEVIDRPSPTAVWSDDHWTEHTYGWGFVPGYWQ